MAHTNITYSMRDSWAKSFYLPETIGKRELWKLEKAHNNRLCLYMSKDKIISGRFGNEDMLGRSPIYHVWDGDAWLYCGQSMDAAYNIFRNTKRQIEKEEAEKGEVNHED